METGKWKTHQKTLKETPQVINSWISTGNEKSLALSQKGSMKPREGGWPGGACAQASRLPSC